MGTGVTAKYKIALPQRFVIIPPSFLVTHYGRNIVQNLTQLATKRCWFSCSARSRVERSLSSQRSQAYVLKFTQVTRFRVAALWNHVGKSVVQPLFSLSVCLFFSGSQGQFSAPFYSPIFFLLFFSLSFHCYHSMTGAWMSLCVGAHGWVAGIASHGSVLLSRGWLVTGHPSSTQLDAVVNRAKELNPFKAWTRRLRSSKKEINI